MQRRQFLSATLTLAALPCIQAIAQTSGSGKPVRVVVSAAAGSTPDVVARLLGQKMSDGLNGAPVVIDNRPGAFSAPAVGEVAHSSADGATILFTDNSTWAITPFITPRPPFDVLRDLQPIAQVLLAPGFLVVGTKVPANNISELVQYANANPGKLTYGSPGIGSPHQLSAELMKQVLGIDILHVPYKGAVQMATAIMVGEIDMAFMGYTAAIPAVQKGSARIFGVSSAQRIPSLPNIPTLQEAGIKGLPISTSMGFLAPVNLPRDLSVKFVKAITMALQSPEVLAKFQDLGLVAAMQSGDTFTTSIRNEMFRYGEIIKRANIKAE